MKVLIFLVALSTATVSGFAALVRVPRLSPAVATDNPTGETPLSGAVESVKLGLNLGIVDFHRWRHRRRVNRHRQVDSRASCQRRGNDNLSAGHDNLSAGRSSSIVKFSSATRYRQLRGHYERQRRFSPGH
ncbi:hypothetical protein T484DRAFT_1972189 [Baffinella frigidus]|nr:hypothetical protein T484DRAFT_1972189 [Cryptophyta sp. CCMP2293]|eukprot:CAMPEP_0180205266 /NCGR_PEP_ID=MMETSP0987-20121128/8889_1 /TAXON_ID=697907 /ORGANISM="non described non described, Strain CCMP2293" /LENGTH=130 /DNA_ID=CAMNT_0022160883 /DNA_START=26 /DNA_END=418 /DNA_ORIENTATION=+